MSAAVGLAALFVLLVVAVFQAHLWRIGSRLRLDLPDAGAQGVESALARAEVSGWLAGGIALAGVVLSGAALSRQLRRRLARLASSAREIADGEGERPEDLAAPDEVGEVARAVAMLALRAETHLLDARMARQRADVLAEVGTELAATLDHQTTLTRVAQLAVPALADWCVVDLCAADGALRRVAVAHADPGRADLAAALRHMATDPHGPHPAAVAVRTGQARMGPWSPALTRSLAAAPEAADLLAALGPQSYVCAPLVARGRTLGAIWLVYAGSGRCYEPPDLELAEELARRAAVAIDNARLFREAEQAREQLARQLEFTGAITESLGEGVLALDAGGRITFANRAAAALLGWREADLVGRELHERVHPAHPGGADGCPLLAPTRAGRSASVEDDLLARADGASLPVSATSAPIRGADGAVAGAVVAFRDVSERKALEARLREVYKMEAVGQLAGGVAHAFNNILTAILGYSELLRERAGEDARLARGLEEIRKAAERAAGLTRQLLAFGRKQVLAPVVVDLNATLAGLEPVLRRLAGEEVEVVLALGSRVGRVKVDPGQLEEVLTHLVVNARDAMPGGGRLLVETADAELDPDYARANVDVQPGGYVRLTLRDTGVGMDAETRAHLFEPFYTTKEVGQGPGLGLSTVYGIVKQSGGHVAVESDRGKGTAFLVYLPRVDQPGAADAPSAGGAAATAGTGTVLLVDDEDALRSIARIVLERHGYAVLEARDGAAALDLAERHPGPVHLLLTDVVMPGMNGRELARRVAALHPETAIVYMSGYTDDVLGAAGRLAPGTPFLAKPFTPDLLLRKVGAAIGQQAAADGRA